MTEGANLLSKIKPWPIYRWLAAIARAKAG